MACDLRTLISMATLIPSAMVLRIWKLRTEDKANCVMNGHSLGFDTSAKTFPSTSAAYLPVTMYLLED